jgi:hypothetical protein
MQTKIKQLASQMYDYGDRFRDVRFAGLMVFVVIVLLISWSGVKVIQTNWHARREVVNCAFGCSPSPQCGPRQNQRSHRQLQPTALSTKFAVLVELFSAPAVDRTN